MHFDVSFTVWVLLGALGAYVSSDLHLSAAQRGLMVAVPPLGGAAARLLLASLADRVGVRRTGPVTMGLALIPPWGWLGGGTYAQLFSIGFAAVVVAMGIASSGLNRRPRLWAQAWDLEVAV